MLVSVVCLAARAAETPEQVVQRYFQATQTQGLAVTADFMHPDEALRFKNMLMPLAELINEKGDGEELEALFGDGATLKGLQAMSGEAFMRRFLQKVMAPTQKMGIEVSSIQVLGQVREGDVVHLVARVRAGNEDLGVTKLQVISMKPYQDSWRMMLSGDMEGLASTIRSTIEKSKKP